MTVEQCRNVSLGMRNSERFQKAIVERNKKWTYRRPRETTRVKRVSHAKHVMSEADFLRIKAAEKKLETHCILITAIILARLKRKNAHLCYRCRISFQVDDIAVPRGYGKPRRKFYHESCWESMFFEC